MQQKKEYEISWPQFEVCNTDLTGAFEKMCRWLFNSYFFDGKALLHSDPNNPGIEVLPQFHSESNKRISFQAKYFSTIDYKQIEHSAEMAIKYYAGQLDVIYLYCNKDVTTSSQQYKDIKLILKAKGIDIIPITNQSILDQVLQNETVAHYYFNNISLSKKWLNEQLTNTLEALGPRYNDEFNVHTYSEKLLNYFLCNKEAVEEVNKTKNGAIENLKNNKWKYASCKEQVTHLIQAISEIEDVSLENLHDCLLWPNKIKEVCSDDLECVLRLKEEKIRKAESAEKNKEYDLIRKINQEIISLEFLLDLPQQIIPVTQACSLMRKQILVVKGNAGVGKSQMFAVASEKLLESENSVLLMLGTNFLNENQIHTQIPEVLSLDISIDVLLSKLEGAGIQHNGYSYILIDAINESSYKSIWKVGLHTLFNKLKSYPHIKLAVSIRTGYEKLVFNDAVLNAISNKNIENIVHNGFREESVNATLTFLNHYGIPFLPSYFLQSEMTNPLFLSLFCKTYSGENFDLFSLFDRLITKADEEAQKSVGIIDYVPILHDLIDELTNIRLSKSSLTISQSDLFDLKFWERYGISTKKVSFVASLVRTGLLISIAHEGAESYYLGYNLLEDFVCAKTILNKYGKKSDLIEYLQHELLKIENGCIKQYQNIDIFIVLCGIYADKKHDECFEDVESMITDKLEKDDIVRRYVESFLWRKASSVDADSFLSFIMTHSVDRDVVFQVLIENSTKENHPLNANFLHMILMNKTLANRDSLWTTYINDLANERERLFQLITYFDEGNLLNGLSVSNVELILILISWLLTSSNRFLRDKASKAAIELLKNYFILCKPLLQHFEDVNDPYVIQRLYGIVFGACVKRLKVQKNIYRELAEYVYAQIFNKEYVYPDILLRDYARLILERWLFENTNESQFIDPSIINPPYNSMVIPVVEKQEYYQSDTKNHGFNRIDMSMRINHSNCPGLYGDFGRYTFQSALENFNNIDIVNLYHYAMQYIRDDLGYNESLGNHDDYLGYYSYNRHETRKIERIGKKYQWIAFYNILARISDKHLLKEWNSKVRPFEGAWEPYVRDFDPTLNRNSLITSDTPRMELPKSNNDFLSTDKVHNISDIIEWKNSQTEFFDILPSKLMVKDSNGNSWTFLYLYDSVKNKTYDDSKNSIGFSSGSQEIWSMTQGYFVFEDQIDILSKYVNSNKFSRSSFPEGADVYQLFNREYAWSSGYRSIFKFKWLDYEIESEEYEIIKEVMEMPDYEHLKYDADGNYNIPFIKKEFEKRMPKETTHIQVMPAYSHFLWEEQYDASQDETTSFHIPCQDIIEYFQLEQKQADGYYYYSDDTLVCFDGRLSNIANGLLIRTDFLQNYLESNNVRLVWTSIGEKQYFLGDFNQEWSSWKGLYQFDSGKVQGEMTQYKPEV